MGRHTADSSSDRGTREHLDRPVVGERRAARDRLRTAEHAVLHATPRVETASLPATATGAPSTAPTPVASSATNTAPVLVRGPLAPTGAVDPRAVKQRRAVATTPAAKAPRTLNSFMRKRATIPALSFFAVFGFVGGSLFNPMQPDVAQAAVVAPVLVKAPVEPQQFTAHGTYAAFDVTRDGYGVTLPKPKVVEAPAATEDDGASTEKAAVTPSNTLAATAATPDPGSAQAIAQQMVAARGWGADQYNCLVSLWNKESGWRVNAYNPSGAYGIPQALPGSKMATAGADWQTNPATQITWGLNYISGVYGTPCGAWGHSVSHNWY
ncbi:transglycosylase SLT domain-containing protein [Curtobacterium sp. MCSS17_007]|uniref:aggregation-promoting factor C-terminal-like domain-containing protein n=1 Tax=Curtobacterium sp. MCSS17_007 TaxID=2175646 RepID=UPI0021AC350D|nr:transglycosylase SLT domain-containing protein [Curtobacterium sp. MCSS17_007]WIE74451.1 lytic transglycosylase domain-containing protein [Curtobacterium sp. MCSS17_007]